MIRILQVIGVMDRGGAETMIMNLYRAMDRSKIQFDFLVHEQREGDYDAEIRELGGRFFRVPRFTGINEHAYRRRCRELFAAHSEWLVVHGHIGACAPIYLSEAKRAGRYTIAHSHAQNFEPGLRGVAFNLVAHPVRHIADYFIGCSREAGLDRFGKRIVEGDSFSILANGIDAQRYVCDSASHELAKADMGLTGRPVMCHVGRLIPVKNHEFLLDVFEIVHGRYPHAVLVLEYSLRQSVASRGLGDAVQFLGVVDNIPAVLRAADIFVFPSIKEGLGLAVVEAQASGLPTLMSTGVPTSALMGGNAQRIALDVGAEQWAHVCLQRLDDALKRGRHDGVELVRSHGFDIAQTSMWLADFYEHAAQLATKPIWAYRTTEIPDRVKKQCPKDSI